MNLSLLTAELTFVTFYLQVKFHQGIEMLMIFKNYASSTSILDDFDFYENRQKIMQEKRIRQSVPHQDLQVATSLLFSSF